MYVCINQFVCVVCVRSIYAWFAAERSRLVDRLYVYVRVYIYICMRVLIDVYAL